VLYDALLHIPGIVRFPGHLPAGRVAEALCEQVDLYPTLAEMLGQTLPRGVQGTSLLPLLRGETEQHKETVYAEVCPPYFANPYPNYAAFIAEWERAQSIEGHPLRWTANFNIPGDHVKALRTADWKYIWYKNGEEELYDLRSDAKETRNLAADSLHAATKAELRHCLFAWVVETEDPRDPKDDQRITDSLPWGEPTLLPGKRPSAG
jgi:arylsulfatase A-like enzyme